MALLGRAYDEPLGVRLAAQPLLSQRFGKYVQLAVAEAHEVEGQTLDVTVPLVPVVPAVRERPGRRLFVPSRPRTPQRRRARLVGSGLDVLQTGCAEERTDGAIRSEVRRLKVSAWASAAQVGCSQVRPLRRSPFGAPT
jgi:hypothetical protein